MRYFLIDMTRYRERDQHKKRCNTQTEAEGKHDRLGADMLYPFKIPLTEGLPDHSHGRHT